MYICTAQYGGHVPPGANLERTLTALLATFPDSNLAFRAAT